MSDDAAPPAVTVDAPVAQDVYQTEASIEVAPRRPLRAAPVPELVDTSLGGQLPRISASNKKPSDVYARLTPMGVIHSDRPKIAILLGGMGLNPKLTKSAIDDLPGDVTFAFAPYGENLQAQVDKARANGHEVLLQLPMEPMGYPANNPGPKTLLADADVKPTWKRSTGTWAASLAIRALPTTWAAACSRQHAALKPVLQEIQKRGLVYLEDSSTSLTSSTDVAKDVDLPERHAQIVIDSDPTPQSIANALDLLENEARTNGFAIGTGSGLEVTLDAVKAWSEQLKNKGILLVPVSAMYKGKLG